MFCRNKDFEALRLEAKYNRENCILAHCNECKNQQKCLEDGRIEFFKDVGYAKVSTLWLNNSCYRLFRL